MVTVALILFAWALAFGTLYYSIPNVFGSMETLEKNAQLIGTENLTVARVVCIIGLIFGFFMLAAAAFLTYGVFVF